MVSVAESTMEEIPLKEEESSVEFRLLMVYAQRLRPEPPTRSQGAPKTISNGTESKMAANEEMQRKKKTKKKKSWRKRLTPQCLRSGERREGADSFPETVKDPEEERARTIVRTLRDIVQRLKREEKENGGFRMMRRVSSVQPDGEDEDEIIANIVQILRSTGDQLNEQINRERSLMERIQGLWSYSFYKKITDCFLLEAVPVSELEEVAQTDRIAMCVHATAALSTLDSQPMSRVLGFGARYLRENYSPWIQSRGGWERVMGIQDEEEEVE